jgi:hypothetical protein
MSLETKCHNLIVELMTLETEYCKLRTFAHEIKRREYSALLKSTEFSGRAIDLRDRAVRLFSQVAQVLTCVDEARDIRLRLLQTSEQLSGLFNGRGEAHPSAYRNGPGALRREPTLAELVDALDVPPSSYDGLSLHKRLLSVGRAASGTLRALRTPSP